MGADVATLTPVGPDDSHLASHTELLTAMEPQNRAHFTIRSKVGAIGRSAGVVHSAKAVPAGLNILRKVHFPVNKTENR